MFFGQAWARSYVAMLRNLELTDRAQLRLVRVRELRAFQQLGRECWAVALKQPARSPARVVWCELMVAADGLARDRERILDPQAFDALGKRPGW